MSEVCAHPSAALLKLTPEEGRTVYRCNSCGLIWEEEVVLTPLEEALK